MSWYVRVVANHPYIIVLLIGALSAISLVISLTSAKLPNFSDPQLGFETRGTKLAQRLITWENLNEASRPSGILTGNPNEHVPSATNAPVFVNNDLIRTSLKKNLSVLKLWGDKKESIIAVPTVWAEPPPASARLAQPIFNTSQVIESDDERKKDILEEEEEWALLLKGPGRLHDHSHHHDHQHLSSDGFFCEGLGPDYSHVVLESVEPSRSLFTLDALYSACEIQQRLMNNAAMNPICETITPGRCCIPWSLPSYIMMLHNRSSCFDITKSRVKYSQTCTCSTYGEKAERKCGWISETLHPIQFCFSPFERAKNFRLETYRMFTIYAKEEDVIATKSLLFDCAKFYNNLELRPDCQEKNCADLPLKCTKYNAVYNILYYLTDTGFLPTNYSKLHYSRLFLNYTMIFLPIARSSAILPYYYSLSSSSFKKDLVQVSAIDFGLKNALFDDCLVRDAALMMAGSGFMILCMWSYTGSLFITVCTILAISMSLIVSYFIYTFLFSIKFFPFMNILAVVVAVGIGADDAFIYCKMWQCSKQEKVNATLIKLVSDTLKHAIVSMFVTSLTTAAAFYSAYISSITAINCFSIFAGTAVLVNFILMVTWLPACIVISERWCCSPMVPAQWKPELNSRIRTAREHTMQIRAVLERCLLQTVFVLRWLWIFIFTAAAAISAVIIFYHPKLRLPDSKNFHLFDSKNLFEQYDIKYKEKFWFERLEKVDRWDNTNVKLPLRFVWGVLPLDNGNYLEPTSKGTLQFDKTFDVEAPESQFWLLNFCRLLRTQRFYQSTLGPLLPNCFIESFKNWMERRCKDPIDDIDRSPCCETSKFPYTREVFNTCIVKAMAHLYSTPADFFLPGVAGPKFSKSNVGKIMAVVVEYDSNHSYSTSFNDMNDFYTEIDAWFQKQLSKAPTGMKGGWFISDLGFYDLQLTLSDGTLVAIGVSMIIAFVVLFLVTLNTLISFYAIVTITFIIFVTVALLVLLEWRLNVLESTAITTAIGLAVDFSLHYGINYRLSEEDDRKSAAAYSLTRMTGPTLMAALTTGAAGAFMLPSSVLAYIQIGRFLVILMGISWLYSTLFLVSLLVVAGPQRGFGQFSYSYLLKCCTSDEINSPNRSDKTFYTAALSESTLSTSSVAGSSAVPQGPNETHELDSVPRSNRRSRRSANSRSSVKKASVPADQSPSSVLLIDGNNIVLSDHLEVETRPKEADESASRH